MKNIFVLGSRGYQASYGGWETFVTNLVDYYHDDEVRFYVGELATDNSKDKVIIKANDNLYLIPIFVKVSGSVKMFLYSIKSYLYVLKYIKLNKLNDSYIYMLGLKLGPMLMFNKHLRKKYHIQVFVNPDGLEHKRSKWNKIIQTCFLMSEWSMIRNSDLTVCDSLGIEKYIKDKYKDAKTTYIAYGAKEYDLSKVKEEDILKEYNLVKNAYCLMVGRCVPENNYELVIKDFMKSKINKDLVIITNLSSSSYYEELKMSLKFESDKRIKFIDGVYDGEKLAVIRKNAYLYIHGHSVGGTNPSLIEAISLTNLNILYDVCFNRDIGKDTCLYFKNEGDLTNLLDDEETLGKSASKLGKIAKKRFKEFFTWEKIIEKYKQIFK